MLKNVNTLTVVLKARKFSSLLSSKSYKTPTLLRSQSSSVHSTVKEENPTRHFEEISIPVPWGHLSGKWYGPTNARPIIGLHGWQDNAGTFDTLAPLLPQHIGFLCLDLPGHGRSSWLPLGMSYHSIDYVTLLLRVMNFYGWEKMSMIGHSMSSINGFVFSAMFPEKVDLMVGLDNLKPVTRSSDQIVDAYKKNVQDLMVYENRTSDSHPPCYKWHELVDRLHDGTNKSVSKETCKYLLNRAIQPSEHDPKKYYFSRDSRLKKWFSYGFSNDVPLDMARRINSPYLFIKALNATYYEPRKYFDEILDIMKKNPSFAYHEVKGTHHVHLNEPEKVAPIINSFISKWRPT